MSSCHTISTCLFYHSCGELSPKHHDKKQEQDYREELFKGLSRPESQLNVIFDCIGNPTEEDLAALDTPTANALRLAPCSDGKVRRFRINMSNTFFLLML